MSHAAALDRLMSLGGELVTAPGAARRKFDLAHMRALLGALGNPEQRFPSILIAGTNGKGSTAATLASILAAAGYTTGLYTSPHLSRVNERIQVLTQQSGNREIEDATLFAHLAEVERAASGLIEDGKLPAPPSFFETMTAIAMLAFAERPQGGPVDIAVLEVGMGGRLDATNVVQPLFSIISDIALDHTEWLGPTLSDIAREKAGILRQNGVMITLPQHPEANQALGEVAVSLGVRGVNAAEYLPGRDATHSLQNRYAVVMGGDSIEIDSPLGGQHQQRNLALAIAAASELRNGHGYNIRAADIERGIHETVWPGRLEEILQPGWPPVLLDVAHNPAGAWALRAALNQSIYQRSAETPALRALIFGCMRDKALVEMAQILFPIFDHIYLTAIPSPRSASHEELAAAADRTGASYTLCSDPAAALTAASANALHDHAPITASGSVVLVGALRSLLLQPPPL